MEQCHIKCSGKEALQEVNSSYINSCFTIIKVKIQAKQEKTTSRKGEWWKTTVNAVARCSGWLLGGYLMAQVICKDQNIVETWGWVLFISLGSPL